MKNSKLSLRELEQNNGQIPGLPANPREWTKADIDALSASIEETPEMLEARGLLVYPWEGKHVIIGGNARFEALKSMKAKDAPCFIIPADTPVDKLKEIAIKDNGQWGKWDFDRLANEWDAQKLQDWGVHVWAGEDADPGSIDALFTGEESAKAKPERIVVELPEDLKGERDKIVELLKGAVSMYNGIQVK